MRNNIPHIIIGAVAISAAMISCKKDVDIPDVFTKFSDNVEVASDGDEIVITCDGTPNHGSPYFSASDSRWEDYNGTNEAFVLNPNSISSQSYEFRIPSSPEAKSGSKEATPMGAMGVSLNGVPFFNQYAAGGAALTNEIDGFDQYNGHPQNTGAYHYHMEPTYLTTTKGKEALLGFLLDGFPVYGPVENGAAVSNADLDEYHGHSHVTADYPDGIYHYHITDADPYINGNGFYGKVGSVSQ
jgi:hypothetical protein